MAVTDEEVRELSGIDESATPFITTAQLVVSEQLLGKGLSEDRLHQLELYLAAHFQSLAREQFGIAREKTGSSEVQYYAAESAVGSGLLTTRFGRMAVMLDTSGTLGAMSKSTVKAQLRVV